MEAKINRIKYFLGWIGYKIYCARIYYRQVKNTVSVNIGENSVLTGLVNIAYPENVHIGNNTYVNGGDIVASKNARIRIGDNCLISYNVHLRTDMHLYKSRNTLINHQGHREDSITIGNDVWIGYGAQIMAGVTVADGTVVAAGAVLTHDTAPYKVYGGVPAKVIGQRGCLE